MPANPLARTLLCAAMLLATAIAPARGGEPAQKKTALDMSHESSLSGLGGAGKAVIRINPINKKAPDTVMIVLPLTITDIPHTDFYAEAIRTLNQLFSKYAIPSASRDSKKHIVVIGISSVKPALYKLGLSLPTTMADLAGSQDIDDIEKAFAEAFVVDAFADIGTPLKKQTDAFRDYAVADKLYPILFGKKGKPGSFGN